MVIILIVLLRLVDNITAANSYRVELIDSDWQILFIIYIINSEYLQRRRAGEGGNRE